MTSLKTKNLILYSINLSLMLGAFYLFILLTAKFLLSSQKPGHAEFLFRMTGHSKGRLIALIENQKIDQARALSESNSSAELEGIFAWAAQDLAKASQKFLDAGNKRFLSYAWLKDGRIDDAEKAAKKIKDKQILAHVYLEKENFEAASRKLLETSDFPGLFTMFARLGNLPTAVFYLYKHGNPYTTLIAKVIRGLELNPKDEMPAFAGKELQSWFHFLKGNFDQIVKILSPSENSRLLPQIKYLQGGLFQDDLPRFSSSLFLEKISSTGLPEENNRKIDELVKKYPKLQVFSVLPETLKEGEFNRTYLYMFGIGLGLLLLAFSVSIFYLYRKYQYSLVEKRQQDLEKMDALHIARFQKLEAQKKRDKTELNVSSFVTLNIQLEVMDAAFTKLGLRVDTKKLAEQIEKSKIPNISYKVYTISNSYGFNVKMQSVTQKDLCKLEGHGAVILVLKGDLIALFKRADSQNAYLQFSKKDSRKVPYSALKLSWEGNIITLNKV